MIKKFYNKGESKKMLSIASGISLFIFVLIILFKIYEIFVLQHAFAENQKILPLFFKGILSDFAGVSRVLLILFFFSIIIPNKLFGRFLSRFILFIIGLIILILFISSSLFFVNALVPLDHSVFLYSFDEVLLTIKATNLGFEVYLGQAVLLLIFVLIFVFSKFGYKFNIIILLLLLVAGFGLYPVTKQFVNRETNMFIKDLIRCKSDYFIYKSSNYLQSPKKKVEKNEEFIKLFIKHRIEDGFLQSADTNNISMQKDLMDFPLLHENNYNPLEPYFKAFSQKPNIVFIIVESLDARVFKDLSQQGVVLAPFISSLKNKSLYWDNCYSVSERTFGVLPAVLGSLPMGKRGFNEADPIPLHKTLISTLGEQDYQTNFFYGGWIGFQKMDNFLSYQPTHHFITNYPEEAKRKAKDFAWGIIDHLVFKHSLVITDSINKYPFLNIYLTLSTHEPYVLPDKDALIAQMKQLNKHLDKKLMNKVMQDKYLSVLYTDNSIKQLMQDYAERGWDKNTIFVITGDHCMHSFGKDNHLQTYAVPLFIYGDLLEKHKKIHAPVSHLDIAPSFFNLLNERGVINKASLSHCLGLGLDTADTRTRNVFIPFMTNNRDIQACLYNQYFFDKDKTYIIGENNMLTPVKNEEITNKLKRRLEVYNQINEYVVHNNRIYPIKFLSSKKEPETINEYNIRGKKLLADKTSNLMSFTLNDSYDKLFFEYSFEMLFTDTLKNPKFEMKIYDENNKYLDYFLFYNDEYMKSSSKPNILHSYKISRSIYDNNNTIFRAGNKIKFSIVDNKKEINLKNLKIKIVSY